MANARDSYVTVKRQTFGGRLGAAFRGTIGAPLLILGGVVLLFWNEGRAVERHRALGSGAAAVVSVAADRPDPAMEGRLVHLSGQAASPNRVSDPLLGVSEPALRLRRRVEMYQWSQSSRSKKQDRVGGGSETVTTHTYELGWKDGRVESERFADPRGHENPRLVMDSATFSATPVTVGGFRLSEELVGQLNQWQSLPVTETLAQGLENRPSAAGRRVRVDNAALYFGVNPAAPALGDLRVRFEVIQPALISVVGRQASGAIQPYEAAAGGTIALLALGEVPAEQLFERAQAGNRALTWALRLLGFGVVFAGLRALFGLLVAAAALIPMLSRLVAAGSGLVAFALAAALSLGVVAAGWITYRPVAGWTLLLLAAAAIAVLVLRGRGKTAVAAVAGALALALGVASASAQTGVTAGTGTAAGTGASYGGFPDVPTTAKAGEFVLVPPHQAIDKAAGADAAKTSFVFYAQKMVAPGPASSRVAFMSTERDLANSWLVPIPRGGRAKVGEIVLTWWQSGSGMQRAIVVGATDPARPVVRYLDLDYENPAKAKDKVTPIGQLEEQLAADSFVPLTAGAPGSVYRCLEGGSPKRYRLVTKAPSGELLLLGHAGRLMRAPATQCSPTPLVPKIAVGQTVEVEFAGGFTKAKIERIDTRIGRAWVTLYGRGDAIAFGDIVP